MTGIGAGIAQGILALLVIAFLAGAAVVGGVVWLWPYLPTITVSW